MFKFKLAIVLFLMAKSLASELTPPKDAKEENLTTEVSSTPWPYTNLAITAAAVLVVGISLVAAITFFLPVMAYRICYSLGGCQNTMDAYVDQFVGNQLGTARNIRSRNKRSMEYIEPILVTLAKAYDQYADQDVKKNFKILRSYTK